MRYELHITGAAENDINEAADYIEFVLMNPQAASDLLDALEETLPALIDQPKRNRVISDPILKLWGIRFTQIKNYLVLYMVDDKLARVYILRFLYMKRDWIGILRGGFSLE